MNMEPERESWNRRYAEGSHDEREPDPFLVNAYEEFVAPLFPNAGRAFDVAGGLGRHAIWLAERQWNVTLVDISDVGIAKARQYAGPLANRIKFHACDLSEFGIGENEFDLIVVFFYLARDLYSALEEALRPGGVLIYKTYTYLQPLFGKGPTHPMHLLHEDELLRAFPRLRVLHYHETMRERGVAEYVGRKK